MPTSDPQKKKAPKTELDRKFLLTVEQAMSKRGIQSDRAMSIELDRHPNFINRVRNGLQSAPPDAWEILHTKFPTAADSITTNVLSQGGGQAVGTVHGDNHYSPTSLEACQVELEQLREKVASQAALLDSKDALIAAQADTINLLRASYNRPN